jgi:hypothetical protein
MGRVPQGPLIEEARQAAEVPADQLARDARMSADRYQEIVAGRGFAASPEEQERLATALGCSWIDFYDQTDKQTAYRGNRGVLAPPISGHDVERLADQRRKQRELEGQTDWEQKRAQLEAWEQWYAGAAQEQRDEHAYAVRDMRQLRQELYGSPTGPRSASGVAPTQARQPQPKYDEIMTSRGPVPAYPTGWKPQL